MSDEMHQKAIEGATYIRHLACIGRNADELDTVVAGINNALTPIIAAAYDSGNDSRETDDAMHNLQSIIAALQGRPIPQRKLF